MPELIRGVGRNVAEYVLYMAALLAMTGLLPLSLDGRLGVGLLHSVAVLFASSRWPVFAWRYLLISTGLLGVAYGIMMYVRGPAVVLARTFGLA
ncbi:MAG: hypothetical protein KA538_08735 [Azonexus sp.]|nr:hypothetical protein [Azonexus sp.]